MADARTILGERLARGEITEVEYDRLLSKLTSNDRSAAQPIGALHSEGPSVAGAPAALAIPPAPSVNWGNIVFIGLALLAVYGVYTWFSGIRTDRIHVTSLQSSGWLGDNISGAIYTEGTSGEIYLWVEMGGKVMCPKKTYLIGKQQRRFEFICRSMDTNGRFKVVTSRSPSDWVKRNATSL